MHLQPKTILLLLPVLLLLACGPSQTATEGQKEINLTDEEYAPGRQLVSQDGSFDEIVAPDTEIEVLAEGFDWTEGPVWIPEAEYLLFTDIPPNSIFKWKEDEGKSLYLTPSGYTGEAGRGGEKGANGLILSPEGRLVLCQHGDRRVAMMDAPLESPAANYVTLAGTFEGKRFNSPNDATFHSNGDLYFTDPPYGLEKNMDDPAKEIPFQGVYIRRTDGTVELLTDGMSRPNGIAFSPDEQTLYVANSDPKQAIWMAFDLDENGKIASKRILFDATDQVGPENKGLPDGLKVRQDGIIFATGPGGVWVFNPEGQHLGTIRTGQATSNCALGNGDEYLYLTADMYLMRVRLAG
ncbi:MAG: SMP-30/gluconolactonase/LRE family protein [Bacteroidota bacterium]